MEHEVISKQQQEVYTAYTLACMHAVTAVTACPHGKYIKTLV
jgi:hypothetical protein